MVNVNVWLAPDSANLGTYHGCTFISMCSLDLMTGYDMCSWRMMRHEALL